MTVSSLVDLQYIGSGIADPTGIWTRMWRDQNTLNTSETDQLLTGQLFSVNRGVNGMFGTAIQVPSTDAVLRLWRNPSVAQLQPGQVATLAQGTLGYEWDGDVDNGPLHALSDRGRREWRLRRYEQGPLHSYQGTNSWVNVVFAKNYLLQTTAADFNGGLASGTEVTSDAGGEVQLTPSVQGDFHGSTLGSTWTKSTLGTGTSTATLSGGVLSLGSAQILGGVTTSPVEARLTIAAAASQYFGLATNLSAAAGNYWAAFTTSTTINSLYGQVNLNGTLTTTKISALLTGYHVYRVQQISTGVQFWIDGVLKLTIAKVIPATASLKIALGATVATPVMQADWARVDAYTSGGTLVSSVLDAGGVAPWGSAQFTASLPAGASLLI